MGNKGLTSALGCLRDCLPACRPCTLLTWLRRGPFKREVDPERDKLFFHGPILRRTEEDVFDSTLLLGENFSSFAAFSPFPLFLMHTLCVG